MKFLPLFILFSFLLSLSACSDDPKNQFKEFLIHSKDKWTKSTPAGLLMANAIKETHDLDIVFYPTAFLDENKVSNITLKMNDAELDQILSLYPDKVDDQFYIGSMRGSDIKRFLFLQAESNYRNELQIAGLEYSFVFSGGLNTSANIKQRDQLDLSDDKVYRIAISSKFYFSGKSAPGYLLSLIHI